MLPPWMPTIGLEGAASEALVPRVAQIAMNTRFRMFPDSDAAKANGDKKMPQLNADQIAMQQLLRGVHF